jgi:zinc/manganese transport system substrate-binding protein
MNRIRVQCIALLASLMAFPLGAEDAPKKRVMCTLPVLKVIADELNGGAFEITALAKPDQDPHNVSPTPSLMKKLREAELFVEIGLQLELWADEVANGSGNPNLTRGGKGRLVASAGIPREEVPAVVSRSEGDVHPEGNPHLWLDPLRAKTIAENIAAGLKGIAPDQGADIDNRLKAFRDKIDAAMFGAELVKEAGARSLTRKALDGSLFTWLEEKKLADKLGGWMKKARPLRGQKMVEFHKSWVYLAKTFGFEIIGSVQPKPGIEPGPQHMQSLAALIRDQKVRAIIVDNFYSLANPNALAEQTGAKVAVVPNQPGGEGPADYVAFIDKVLDTLLEASK